MLAERRDSTASGRRFARQTAFLVFLPAAAGAWVVAPDFWRWAHVGFGVPVVVVIAVAIAVFFWFAIPVPFAFQRLAVFIGPALLPFGDGFHVRNLL